MTTVSSSTSLSATVPATVLTAAGPIAITVRNTTTTELVSAPAIFTVANATPTIVSVAPGQAVAASSDFVLTVNGTNFVNGAQILWGGEALTTNFVNAGQQTATVAAAHLALGCTVSIAVTNPAPVVGISDTQPFLITPVTNAGTTQLFLPLVSR